MKRIKRMVALVLAISMVCVTNISVFAADVNDYTSYTVDEIKSLRPYIFVKDGKLLLNQKEAQNAGVPEQLINGQSHYFDMLNQKAEKGLITISKDLSIQQNESVLQPRLSHAYNCGGGKTTNTEYHWWGYSRYLCDCRSNDFAADLNSAASVAAGAAAVATFVAPIASLVGIDSAYWWLVASRIDRNNNGRGVYIEMTYALVFDITPQ